MTAHAPSAPFTTLYRSDIYDRISHFAGGDLTAGVSSERAKSYDHCFNYFAANTRPTEDLEKSCTVLGFYLASWGMYRGSTFLFKNTNSSRFIGLIRYIEENGPALRAIDVDHYDKESIEVLRQAYADIRRLVLPEQSAALTLVTKIMVAAFGCVPAYDTYFVRGIRALAANHDRTSFGTFSTRSLELLADFYRANRVGFDDLAKTARTATFPGSSSGGRPLSKAKLVDMYVFDLGFDPNRVQGSPQNPDASSG